MNSEYLHPFMVFGGGNTPKNIHSASLKVERPDYLIFNEQRARFMIISAKEHTKERRIHYEVYGNGPRKIMLFMGVGGTHVQFENALVYFGLERGTDYSIAIVDNRGCGFSSIGSEEERWTTSLLAQDGIELIDHLGKGTLPGEGKEWLEGVELGGVSMGGMIALEMVLHAPEKFSSLTLIATYPGGLLSVIPPLRFFELVKRALKSERDQINVLDRALEVLYPPEWLDANDPEVEDSINSYKHHEVQIPNGFKEMADAYNFPTRRFYIAKNLMRRNRKYIECTFEDIRTDVPKKVIRKQVLAIFTHYISWNRLEHLRKYRIPTLVIAGGKDPLVNPINSFVLAKALDAEFLFFSDAAHGVNDHKMHKVHKAMERLIKRRRFDRNRQPFLPQTNPWLIVLVAFISSIILHKRFGVSKSASFGVFALASAYASLKNGGPWLI